MDTQLLSDSHDYSVFDFSSLPLSPLSGSVADCGRNRQVEPTPEAAKLAPLARNLLPWIAAHLAAAIGLGACLAQAMPPTATKRTLADEMDFVLRLGSTSAALAPIPGSIQEGFRLRFGSTE